MSKYTVKVGNDIRLTFEADFAQAADTIIADGDTTPFQVADASHDPHKAATLLNDWFFNQGGEAWGVDEKWELTKG